MRTWHILLVGGLAFLLGPGQGLTQMPMGGRQGGGRFGGGNRGGRGGFGDPGAMFDQMSGGKSEIDLKQVTDQRRKWFLDRIAQSAGITNGKLSKDQYLKGMENMRAQFTRGGAGGWGRPMGGGGAPATGGATTGSTDPNAGSDAWAEGEFKRRDRNGDGFLNVDEMSKSFRKVWEKYDTNKDGRIDLNEFKVYIREETKQRQKQFGGGQGGQVIATVAVGLDQEDKKPIVYRAGKLPKDIPAYFEKIDTNNDGQIGLYEWVKAGRDIEEFKKIDRNGDGFLTIQEVMRHETLVKAAQKKKTDSVAKKGTTSVGNRGTIGGFGGNRGGFNGGGFGGGRRNRGQGN